MLNFLLVIPFLLIYLVTLTHFLRNLCGSLMLISVLGNVSIYILEFKDPPARIGKNTGWFTKSGLRKRFRKTCLSITLRFLELSVIVNAKLVTLDGPLCMLLIINIQIWKNSHFRHQIIVQVPIISCWPYLFYIIVVCWNLINNLVTRVDYFLIAVIHFWIPYWILIWDWWASCVGL